MNVNLHKSDKFIKLRSIVIFLFLITPYISFSQMESDSLISMMRTDSINLDQTDTLQNVNEIETTVNYKAKDSIFYDL